MGKFSGDLMWVSKSGVLQHKKQQYLWNA